MTTKTVLGWDVSSSTLGYGLLEITDTNIKYITSGYIKPDKNLSLIDKLADTRNQVKAIIDKYKPDYIGIEDILKFMKGKSSANTIITLTMYNRMVCLLAYDYLQNSPALFNVSSVRHGLKFSKVLPKKEEMPEVVAKHLNITFPYLYNKRKNLIVENYDVADGIAIATFYALKLTGKIKKK